MQGTASSASTMCIGRSGLHAWTRGISAAPASLQTPYQRAGLTPALYATWMEKHAAEEVAAAADATLDAFEAKRGEMDAEAAAAAEKVRRAKRLLFP